MTELKINLQNLILNGFNSAEIDISNTDEINIFDQDMYIPPNYGAPNSQHGSGTR